MNLNDYVKFGTLHMSLKSKIVLEYLDGNTISKIGEAYDVNHTSVKKLVKLWDSGDRNSFEKSSIAKPKKPLIDPLSVNEKEKLYEIINSSNCEALVRNCRLVLSASRFSDFSSLARSAGIKCPKLASKYLNRYKSEGINGLYLKSTGVRKYSEKEISDRRIVIEKTAEDLWKEKESTGFITDANLAAVLEWSEPTIEKVLRGHQYAWRRPSKTRLSKIYKTANRLHQRVAGIDVLGEFPNTDFVTVYDSVILNCKFCSSKRIIKISTLLYDQPGCPVCVRNKPKHFRNITQFKVVSLVQSWYRFICGKDYVFLHDVTPSFIYKATRRLLRVDGFCNELEMVLEYQGALHNRPVFLPGITDLDKSIEKHHATVSTDKQKRAVCKRFGYLFVEVQELKNSDFTSLASAIIEAFQVIGTRVPSEDELHRAYALSPRLGQYKITDTKRFNCCSRIRKGQSKVASESRKLNCSVSAIYGWLKKFDSGLFVTPY